MLPGVNTRVLVVNDPMPPTIAPYIDPPLASSPWHAAHCAVKRTLPSATLPLPLGRFFPSGVRTSMFQAAMSPSEMGLPKRGLPDWPSATPELAEASSRASAPAPNLCDRIFHLPGLAHRPRENSVVMLHEANERAGFRDLGHGGLHVAGTVDGAACDLGWAAIPVPDVTEAGQGAIEDRFFQHRLAPGLAAVDRDVDGFDSAVSRPGETFDRIDARPGELHPSRGSRDDGLALHDEAELPPFAFGHRIGVARGLAAQGARLVRYLDAPDPLDRYVALPTGDEHAQRVALFGSWPLPVLAVDQKRVRHHLFDRDGAGVSGAVRAFEQHPLRGRIAARLVEQR